MPVLAVTGGVATGKSSVSQALGLGLEATCFSADAEVARLLAEDSQVAIEVAAALGPGVMGSDGRPDRNRLRTRIFEAADARKELEGILHPRVRTAWERQLPHFRVADRWLVVEIPLLYETKSERLCDVVIVVACSRSTQLDRMIRGRNLGPDTAAQIIAAQMDVGEKIRQADHVIWNDGSKEALENQVQLLVPLFRARWGN